MYRFCVFIFFAVAAVALVPFEEVNTDIFHGQLVESSIRDALKEANDITSERIQQGATAFKIIPYVGSVATFVSNTLRATDENVWKDTLITTISDQILRSVMQSKVDSIRSILRTVSQNIRSLKNHDLSNVDAATICITIYNDLSHLVNLYLDGDTVRQYPQFAYVPLSMLSSILTVFHPILQTYSPEFASNSNLACRLESILLEYRILVVAQRIKYVVTLNIHKSHWNSPLHTNPESEARANLIKRPYNPLGYNESHENGIRCTSKGCPNTNSDHDGCLRDEMTGQEFFIHNTVGWKELKYCYSDYINNLQYRVEQIFDKSLSLVKNVCTNEMKKRRRPNGYGWWSIFIYSVNKGGPVIFCCYKSYIKLYVGGNEVLRTETIYNPIFDPRYYTFTSGRMRKTTDVVIESWDKRVIVSDDKILSHTIHIQDGDTLGEAHNGNNYVKWRSVWRDEYEDD